MKCFLHFDFSWQRSQNILASLTFFQRKMLILQKPQFSSHRDMSKGNFHQSGIWRVCKISLNHMPGEWEQQSQPTGYHERVGERDVLLPALCWKLPSLLQLLYASYSLPIAMEYHVHGSCTIIIYAPFNLFSSRIKPDLHFADQQEKAGSVSWMAAGEGRWPGWWQWWPGPQQQTLAVLCPLSQSPVLVAQLLTLNYAIANRCYC